MAAPVPAKIKVKVDNREALRELEEAERKVASFDQAVSKAGVTSGRASTNFAGLTKATRNQGRAFGEAVNLTSELGLGFAALGPKAREVSVQFASAGNNAVILGGVLGPIGVVVGLVATALPILITELVNLGDEASNAADEMDKLGVSLDQARTKISALDASRARASRREQGAETTEEARAFRATRASRFRDIAADLQRDLQRIGLSADAASAIITDPNRTAAGRRVQGAVTGALLGSDPQEVEATLERVTNRVNALADARTELATATAAETLAIRENTAAASDEAEAEQPTSVDRGRSRRRRGSRGPSANLDLTNLSQLERELEREEGFGPGSSFTAGTRPGLDIEEPQAVRLEAERQIAEELARQLQIQKEQDELEASLIEGAKQKAEIEKETTRQQMEEAAVLRENQAIRDKTFSLVNQGTEAALDLFEANEGTKELIMGFSQVAQAIGSYPDGFGIAQHGISAALHFANAAKLGVGGGGGAPPVPNAPTQAPGFGDGGNTAGGVSVINFNAPVPEALQGREQRRAARAFQARFGS